MSDTSELQELKRNLNFDVQQNIKAAVEDLGVERVVDAVGLERVIGAVGLERVIGAVGLEKIIEAVDPTQLDKIIEFAQKRKEKRAKKPSSNKKKY